MNRYVYTFSSLSEFIDMVDIPRPVGAADTCAWDYPDDSWSGAPRPAAFEMARLGWDKGRENMVEAMAQARPSIALPPAFTLDVGGAYPDPAAAAAGVPDCMVSFDPVEVRNKPIVRLGVNVWASASYKPEEFTAYGAAVLSYIDAIEAGGYRVELTMLCHCFTGREQRDTYTVAVPIKRAEEPIEIDRLTYCLTHVAMLRRLFFSHMQIAPGAAGKMPNCGYPRNPDAADVEPGLIVVPGINTIKPGSAPLKSPKACAEHITSMMQRVLTQVGVELPELAFGGGSK